MSSPRSRTSPPRPIVFKGLTPNNAGASGGPTNSGKSPLLQNMGFRQSLFRSRPHRRRRSFPPQQFRIVPDIFDGAGATRKTISFGHWGSSLHWNLPSPNLTVECNSSVYSPPSNRRNRLSIILNGVQQLHVHLSQVGSDDFLVRFEDRWTQAREQYLEKHWTARADRMWTVNSIRDRIRNRYDIADDQMTPDPARRTARRPVHEPREA